MSIGDALAAARRQEGLTITQVSQRTCIRETIVRGIERGDYSACGGDFYARGHIRSIARTVGLEPEELIREYDATQAPPQPITAADVFQPFTPVKLKERRRPNWSCRAASPGWSRSSASSGSGTSDRITVRSTPAAGGAASSHSQARDDQAGRAHRATARAHHAGRASGQRLVGPARRSQPGR